MSGAPAERVTINVSVFAKENAVIVGELGIPLGTVAEIEAVVVNDSEKEEPMFGYFLLSVEKVNGTLLPKPKLLRFSAPFTEAMVFATHEDLRQRLLKSTATRGKVTETEVQTQVHKYVGTRLKLVAYERGRFDGAPRHFPDGVIPFQGTVFGYESELVILKKR